MCADKTNIYYLELIVNGHYQSVSIAFYIKNHPTFANNTRMLKLFFKFLWAFPF